LTEHIRGADVLVIEATFLDRDAAIARDYGHLTATEAAALAAMSGVKLLVLTHISGRYPDEEILAEATKTFPNSRVARQISTASLSNRPLRRASELRGS
jgi:ribonuclease Z